MRFSEVVEQQIGFAALRQLALLEFLGEHSWQLDLERGTVNFGKSGFFSRPRVFPIQVIGTESKVSNTWLWAWANEASHIPAPVLKSANRLRAFGEANGVSELLTDSLSLAEYPGHLLASVASGICEADCYYRGPYGEGAVFFLIFGTPLGQATPATTPRIATVLMDVICQYDIQNHRNMAAAFLRAEGFRLTEETDGFFASAAGGRSLNVRFDREGRLAGVDAKVA